MRKSDEEDHEQHRDEVERDHAVGQRRAGQEPPGRGEERDDQAEHGDRERGAEDAGLDRSR